jgi:hypothetical protein
MRLFVPLSHQEFEALQQLAYDERRRPQDQAAVLVAQALAVGSATGSPPDPESTPGGLGATDPVTDDPVDEEAA